MITDVVMPDDNAFDLLPRIKRMRPDLPIIVMSAQNTLHHGDQSLRARRVRIPAEALRSARTGGDRRSRAGRTQTAAQEPEAPGEVMPIVGRSPAMQDIFRYSRPTDANRSYCDDFGESGHRQGARSRKRCTTTASARAALSSPSTWPPFHVISSKASCSATRRAPHRRRRSLCRPL